jgi:hypothetical protein
VTSWISLRQGRSATPDRVGPVQSGAEPAAAIGSAPRARAVLGVVWSRRFGRTAELLRAARESTDNAQLVAGLRIWF